MGVTYKLTDDIVRFILQEKQQLPSCSCRELATKIQQQFQKEVSKSAVHEVLKAAKIISPRGRKGSTRFQIPKEKKEQILAGLPMLHSPLRTQLPPPLTPPSYVTPFDFAQGRPVEEPLQPLQKSEEQWGLKELLLQTAMYDLFPKPWHGINHFSDFKSLGTEELCQELEYRQIPIACFGLELEDGCSIYIQSQFNGFSADLDQTLSGSLPIERALKEATDRIVNNLQPIVIKEFKNNFLDAQFFDFLKAVQADQGKQIVKITLLRTDNSQVIEFKGLASFRRNFIVQVSPETHEFKDLVGILPAHVQTVSNYFQDESIKYFCKNIELGKHTLRVVGMLDSPEHQSAMLLSNFPGTISDGEIIQMYTHRHPVKTSLAVVQTEHKAADRDKNFLTWHMVQYFGDEDVFQEDDLWGKETVQVFQNKEFYVVTVYIPNNYNRYDKIVSGLSRINAQAIKTYEGQQIFFKTAKI